MDELLSPETSRSVAITITPDFTKKRATTKMRNERRGSVDKLCSQCVYIFIFLVFINFLLFGWYLHFNSSHKIANPNMMHSTNGDTTYDNSATDDKEMEGPLRNLRLGFPLSFNTTAWPYIDMDNLIKDKITAKHFGPIGFSPEYDYHRAFEKVTGCDLITVPFNPEKDERCLKYMSNQSNWEDLRPLSMSEDQRTVKFEVVFTSIPEAGGIRLLTMIKVPQRLFPYEAFSEVTSYHVDRVAHINRIPPTAWVCIPYTKIEDSINKYESSVETISSFLHESGVNTYTEWVKKDFIDYNKMKDPVHTRGKEEDDCVGVSMQLRIADVGHLLHTVLRIPYKTHSTSWHGFLDILHNRKEPSTSSAVYGKLDSEPIFFSEIYAPSILHISELNVYDWIISNDDRSPNKNNFVVGGCIYRDCQDVPTHNNGQLRHPGHPTFIHLDQGRSFYKHKVGIPMSPKNPIYKGIHNPNDAPEFCLFRTPLVNRLLELAQFVSGSRDGKYLNPKLTDADRANNYEGAMNTYKTVLHVELLEKLPSAVLKFTDEKLLRGCSIELYEVLDLLRRCLEHSNLSSRPWILTP